jgi:fatty-acyl-CoA synthase
VNLPLTPIRMLRYARDQFPARTAVVCGNDRFTYGQLAERVSKLAGALRKMGVQKGDRVAFLSLNCHRFLEAYYAVPEAGAIFVPVNTRLTPGELAYILNDAGVSVLFFEEAFLETVEKLQAEVPSLKTVVQLDAVPRHTSWLSPKNYEEHLAEAAPYHADLFSIDENSVAEMFYTSGTTAKPKGVMLSHRNVYLHALNYCVTLNPGKLTVHLHTIPLFHVNGWGTVHYSYLGAVHVMIPRFRPVEVFKLIEQERVTSINLVPTMAAALINAPERAEYDLKSLERIRVGGSPPPATMIRDVQEKLGGTAFCAYGLTEASPSLTMATIKQDMGWNAEQQLEKQAMTGYALPGAEVRVIDAEGNDVPRDGSTVGQIIARSDGVMSGYWNQPEASAKAVHDGWLYTGDMAVVDKDGYLLIVDRMSDFIISGGENISSLELENTLLTHPSVAEAAVIPVPDEKWGEVPKALIVLKPDTMATEEEMIDYCRFRLARFKVPRSVEFLPNLPKTGTGKILKKDLRAKYTQADR